MGFQDVAFLPPKLVLLDREAPNGLLGCGFPAS